LIINSCCDFASCLVQKYCLFVNNCQPDKYVAIFMFACAVLIQ
jgi:hypothetical protein